MMIDRHIELIASESCTKIDWLRKALTCLDINNVADWTHNQVEKNGSIYSYNFKNVEYLMPPWPLMWCEYSGKNNPFWINLGNVGILTVVIDDKIVNTVFLEVKIDNKLDIVPGGTVSFFYDKITKSINKYGIVRVTPSYHSESELENRANQSRISSCLFPVIFAIAFTHCKNVDVDKIEISKKLQNSRIKRGKQPFFRFNTIIIDPMRNIIKTEGGAEMVGFKRALHICRGHFATYTDEHPLFGRVTGTFWKSMHLRGNKKEGVVIKDYKIEAPQ